MTAPSRVSAACAAALRIAAAAAAVALGPAASASAFGAGPAGAGQEDQAREPLEAVVTAVSGTSVYVDRGRESGVRVGDRVEVVPLAGAPVEGRVRVVSSRAARVELEAGEHAVMVGDRARVFAAPPPPAVGETASAEPPPAEPGKAAVPEHPPWEADEGPWAEDAPLLAPASASAPDERPREIEGRATLRGAWGRDGEDGSDGSQLWLGSRLEARNPFGRGGELAVDVDAFARAFDDEEDDDDERRLRVERLSYAVGGDRGRPTRLEVGRFLQEGMPELGVLDGIALERRLPSGDAVGASLGFLTAWTDAAETGDDLQVAAWYRYVSGDDGAWTAALALQKTWHEGEPDRDLAVLRADWRPFEQTLVHGSAWIDLYGSGDADSGLDLTQALLTVTQGFDGGHGLALTATRYGWPDLKQDDLFVGTEDDVLEGEVERLSLRGWRRLTEALRLQGRATAFSDQDESGGSLELGLSARDLLYDRGVVSLDVYDLEGKHASGVGARASASRTFDAGTLRLDLDVTDYDGGSLGGSDGLLHERVRLAWDQAFLGDWSLSLHVERRFGDQQDSETLGFLLQRRF